MFVETIGAFGRKARLRHGPMAVIRAANPASLAFVQLASTEHKHNVLQYSVTPGVRSVKADQQLPTWLSAFVPKKVLPFTQVIEFARGDLLIVRLRRDWQEREPVVSQLRPKIWYVERSTLDVALPAILNRNLDRLGQAHITHHTLPLRNECDALVDALQSVKSTTLGDLKAYASARVGLSADLVTALVARFLFIGQLSIQLASHPLRDSTPITWGASGVGYMPPVPRWDCAMRQEAA